MTQEQKDKILESAQEVMAGKQAKISEELQAIPRRLAQLKEMHHALEESADGELTYQTVARANRKRYDQLQQLYPSPYFNRLTVKLPEEKIVREVFFGKFPFPEEDIYSWTSPLAVIRFNQPGSFNVDIAGHKKTGWIEDKDQYLIVDGQIKFFAREKSGRERELIYQEYFSQRKTDFILPEIVAQMEKAQDEVVRAEISGPLVIAGPAGSGKTTLALHRIAYLLQSPDTAHKYSPEKILVLVQDSSTKNYFSQLLPSFGIKDVLITTFNEWAFDILDLKGLIYQNRFLDEEIDNDRLEAAKLKALRSGLLPNSLKSDVYSILQEFYKNFFSSEEEKLFRLQRQEKILDRFDLTILMRLQSVQNGLEISRNYYRVAKDKSLTTKVKRERADYSLIVVDEFENYMPEQLQIISGVLNKKNSSILYVGDLSQQILIGTIDNWSDLGDDFSIKPEDKIIRLQKVYRNTKEILNYIASLGYPVDIPEQLRNGPKVIERDCQNFSEAVSFIEENIKDLSEVSIGVVILNNQDFKSIRNSLPARNNLKILPINEAQGVEFDTVFVVKSTRELDNYYDGWELARQKIAKDKLYVALTRAMNGLYIINLS